MKRFFAIMLSAMFVLGLAASVYAAELKIGGDAYVEGVMRTNYDMNSRERKDDDYRWWEQRYRLKLDAILENGIEVRTRLRISDAIWDGNAETRLGDSGASSSTNTANPTAKKKSTSPTNGVSTDYAYLHVPIGAVTIDAGHQLASWGLGFWIWDEERDRVNIKYAVNSQFTVGGIIQKDKEEMIANNKGDKDSYIVYALAKPDDKTDGGIIVVYTQDQPNRTSEATEDHPKQDGWQVDVFGSTKNGNMTFKTEAAYKTGAMFATTTGGKNAEHCESFGVKRGACGWNNQFGAVVLGIVDLSPIVITAGATTAVNGFVADNDFAPTYFFGTNNNPLAIADFQSFQNDRTTWATKVNVDYKVNDALTVGGRAAYAWIGLNSQDLVDGGASAEDTSTARGSHHDYFSIAELDGTIKYQISKSTDYTIGVAYGIPLHNVPATQAALGFGTEDDKIFGAFHKLSIKF